MSHYLWLVPALPYLGFLSLLLCGGRLSRAWIARIGVGSIALSAIASLAIAVSFLGGKVSGDTVHIHLWNWIPLLSGMYVVPIEMGLWLDSLSLLMICIVTVVGSLIALFSVSFMDEDPDVRRFFCVMNLFVGSMLMLVLADNLLLLYAGWEGVGLCSYLLIGFWYKDTSTGRAATKAFLTTRVGDIALLIGIVLIFMELGTLDIRQILLLAPQYWTTGAGVANVIGLCILGGAVGKSAQLPLQTWLPDAMLGPTPVSALIHAATMVTAGVYLIARMHGVFELAPEAQHAVLFVGAATLLMAGLCALVQSDLKRVLAYSTVSQIGYMFLALGAGAYSAAMFHLMTHACFKALLFLSAGVIGHTVTHDYNMFKMGGLRKESPLAFWMFIIGGSCLAAVPIVTSGFYSKEWILSETFASTNGGFGPWFVGLVGAFLTGLYTFRMIFITFFGDVKKVAKARPDWKMAFPLCVLALLAVGVGFVQMPSELGGILVFGHVLSESLPMPSVVPVSDMLQLVLLLLASVVSLSGIALAYYLFFLIRIHESETVPGGAVGRGLHAWLYAGFGFDRIYDVCLVRPYCAASMWLKGDGIAAAARGLGGCMLWASGMVSRTQTGFIRYYVAVLVCGAVLLIGVMVFS